MDNNYIISIVRGILVNGVWRSAKLVLDSTHGDIILKEERFANRSHLVVSFFFRFPGNELTIVISFHDIEVKSLQGNWLCLIKKKQWWSFL